MLNRSTYLYLGFLLSIGFTYGAYKFTNSSSDDTHIGKADYNQKFNQDPNIQKIIIESRKEVVAINTRLASLNEEKEILTERKDSIQTFIDKTKDMMSVMMDVSSLPKSKEGRERILKIAAAIINVSKNQIEDGPFAKITSASGDLALRFEAEKFFRSQASRDQLRSSKIRKFETLMARVGQDVVFDKITIFQASDDLDNTAKLRLKRLKEYFIKEFNGTVDNFEVRTANRDELPTGAHFVLDIAISEKAKDTEIKSKNVQSKTHSNTIAASTDAI